MYHELLHFRTDCRVKIGDQGAFVEATVDSDTVKSGEELVYRPGFLAECMEFLGGFILRVGVAEQSL